MIAIDLIIAVLLLVTIWYCFRLNSKIVELQRGKKDLAILFKYFDNAIKRAEEALESLKHSTSKTSHTIDAKVQESKTMIDEMAFFIEKSNKTLKHLEDIQAKISLKEHIIQQDTAAAVRHNNNFYTQPSNDYKPQEQLKKPIITSPSTVIYGSKPAVPQPQEAEDKQDSKKLAIESLLEKIAEIQKRSRGNAS